MSPIDPLTERPFPDVPEPTPPPVPVPDHAAIVAAARALAADPEVMRFVGSHHFGYLVQVAKRLRDLTKAVDAE